MHLQVNVLIEWIAEESEPCIERVLWIDSIGRHAAVIDVLDPKALPVLQECEMIEKAIAAHEARLLTVDPYANRLRPEGDIPIQHRQLRDDAWESIASLVEAPNNAILNPKGRGVLVAAAADRAGCTKSTIYKRLRRYWQGGQTRNALLPRFDRCGGQG